MPKKKTAKKAGPELVPWNDGDRLVAISWLLDQDQLKPHRSNVKLADWDRLAANAPPATLPRRSRSGRKARRRSSRESRAEDTIME